MIVIFGIRLIIKNSRCAYTECALYTSSVSVECFIESRLAFSQWSFVSQRMTKYITYKKNKIKSSDNNSRYSERKTRMFARRTETKTKQNNDLYYQMIHLWIVFPSFVFFAKSVSVGISHSFNGNVSYGDFVVHIGCFGLFGASCNLHNFHIES